MAQVHAVIGSITLIVSVALLIWNGLRLARREAGPSFRIVLVGLLDLQVLLGIITFILQPRWGVWLLHPLFALAAVVVAHAMLKERRPGKTQILGYVLVLVLLLAAIA